LASCITEFRAVVRWARLVSLVSLVGMAPLIASAASPAPPLVGPRRGPGGEVRVFGAVHRPAIGVAIAIDYAWRRAALAVGAEFNPYVATGPGDLSPGALHFFGGAEHRVPIGRVTLRQRLAVGPAILLADTLGPPRGSVGLFLEAAPLSVEMQTQRERLAVTLEAFSLAISAPALGEDLQLRYQYRAGIGLRF
jgi:hypothetical protein